MHVLKMIPKLGPPGLLHTDRRTASKRNEPARPGRRSIQIFELLRRLLALLDKSENLQRITVTHRASRSNQSSNEGENQYQRQRLRFRLAARNLPPPTQEKRCGSNRNVEVRGRVWPDSFSQTILKLCRANRLELFRHFPNRLAVVRWSFSWRPTVKSSVRYGKKSSASPSPTSGLLA